MEPFAVQAGQLGDEADEVGVTAYRNALGWAAMSAERKRMWLIVVVCFVIGFAWSRAYDQYHLSFWWAVVIFAALVGVAWLRDRGFKRKQRGGGVDE